MVFTLKMYLPYFLDKYSQICFSFFCAKIRVVGSRNKKLMNSGLVVLPEKLILEVIIVLV